MSAYTAAADLACQLTCNLVVADVAPSAGLMQRLTNSMDLTMNLIKRQADAVYRRAYGDIDYRSYYTAQITRSAV
jgi:hypothetical protein